MSKHTLWKNLSCELTQEEVTIYSLELANATIERDEIESHKKEVLSDFTARINKCMADAAVLSRKVQTRKEDRQVECDLDFDYAKGMVYTVRTDTGVTIGQRKLTDDERQQWLDLDNQESRRQEAEDKREEDNNIIEGEVLQIEHKPDIEICGNTECHYHDATEGNGCKQHEMVWECKQAVQETEEKDCKLSDVPLSDDEMIRRDGICKEWRLCDYKDTCFTPENEEVGICFVDSQAALPKNIDQKAVNKLVVTSADDCKTSLNFVTDMDVLHEALER
jgi:hypothetical protein